ncbi:group II intron reverse transcriptase/maturase [Rhodohalobacter sulfatireducens]|uniref:RNA-directed DNA polymerase n=1 Tax=Rhodohalobacter sulfatireducens TaxID=2911366 RepID=A0ABS9KJR3_9BACT|nr:group II intron reverse transcriptase/maturase [Rhodohalobacter sulfatireducens]MCG2591101.1 group II intron reverse transcriptase/maturase [Rhodohalobacter sulfatireducens]
MTDYYETKSQPISKLMVWMAYRKVKANGGSAGIDRVSLEAFSNDLSGNLYKLWNRLSSGSYFPPPVKQVKIPKKSGGQRSLGIPTVADRIAQQVVKTWLEPKLEPIFHEDSYGYRPGKSAHQALAKANYRCRYYDWVLDLDIAGFFDNIDHDLMLKALDHYHVPKWVCMYVQRWLQADVVQVDGQRISTGKGTPQGGVISPLLANLYLHVGFDGWMRKHHPNIPFERYADDIVVHTRSKAQAEFIKGRITARMEECNLQLHPEKTHIVYCKDERRRENQSQTSFDFLGYTFRPRMCNTRQGRRLWYLPCMSRKAKVSVTEYLKKLNLHKYKGTIQQMAGLLNTRIRGWMNYYCQWSKWTTTWVWRVLNLKLIKWLKWNRRFSKKRAVNWLKKVYKANPGLFAHWSLVHP